MIPGRTDPAKDGVHELTVIREATPGEYIANAIVYSGSARASVTVQLWDLRGWSKRRLLTRTFAMTFPREQRTAFRWRLNASGAYAGHDVLPFDLMKGVGLG